VTALRNRRGIALPVTIFIITLMTITLAAAFARVGAEREVATGASEAISALTVAQSGLQRYLGVSTSRPPDGDSVRFNVTGGYADVVARIVESDSLDDQKTMYVLRSTGYVIVPAQGATAQGKRTVAQFAQWQVGNIRAVAAFVAANQVRTATGGGVGSIRFDGIDGCASALPVVSARARSGSQFNTGTYAPTPAVVSGSGGVVADTTGIDWRAIVGGTFTPDYRTLPPTGVYSSYLISGDATLNTSGTGLLIVTGDLTTTGTGTVAWYGVVLVGGAINFNARRNQFYGLVVSGLNEQLGGAPPPQGTIGGGGGSSRYWFEYDSCHVANAVEALTGLAPIRNAWVDNWASY
jgi:hypothetical protein